MPNLRRRLRGALGNVVAWGIGWTVLGFATTIVLRMTGLVDPPVSIRGAAEIGLKIGLGGCIAGAAFSAFIAFRYRNRRLQDIDCVAFGLGGAVVTAAAITGFVEGASLLGGGGLVPWRYMNPTVPIFALFGFGAAALSMRLAQSASSHAPDIAEVSADMRESAQLASGAGAMAAPARARVEVGS